MRNSDVLTDIIELADNIKKNANLLLKSQVIQINDSSYELKKNPSDKYAIADEGMYKTAEKLYKLRRLRDKEFADSNIFADPGWDILLDLFMAHLKNRQISVSSACLAAHVPATTGLRWLNVLEELGLIEREQDGNDARRRYVRLTTKAFATLTRVLAEFT